MKSILFVLVMVAAQFANAKEAKAVKVSAYHCNLSNLKLLLEK